MTTRIVTFLHPSGASAFLRGARRCAFHVNANSAPEVKLHSFTSQSVPCMVSAEPSQEKRAKQKAEARPVRRAKKGSQSKAFKEALAKYEPVIGVEVHVQLLTGTKAFCSCSTRQARTSNVNICPVCMGYPGALPVLNEKVVEMAAKAGMALRCSIAEYSRFDRKNYYYADTAKNYQISQHLYPIAQRGHLILTNTGKRVGITRLHMEEDSAKMSHEGSLNNMGRIADSSHSLVDFNRGGVPLIEIVSEPDMRSGSEAAEYGQELRRVLRYIGASDCNMQDGSMRFDVNVSIRPKDAEQFGTKVELKNLNSFTAVQKSVDFEIERQAALLDAGERVVQETRTWDEKQLETRTMRVKEGSADYRYFPEPDIPPLHIDNRQLQEWERDIPELPIAKRERFQAEYGLSQYDSFVLTDDVDISRYMDATVAAGAEPKQAANWIMGDVSKILNAEKIGIRMSKLSPEGLAEIVDMITKNVISGKIAKELIPELITKGGSPSAIVAER